MAENDVQSDDGTQNQTLPIQHLFLIVLALAEPVDELVHCDDVCA